jgi:transcriptional regulator GlxA family with amidase domain
MELLIHSTKPVLDVAAEVGFESPTAFSVAFAELVGESPGEYRRRQS